jgi:hypothetical protein
LGLVGLAGEEAGGFAEQDVRLAGLSEDAYWPGQTGDMFLDSGKVGVVASKEEDAAVRVFAAYLLHQKEAILAGHGDITKEKIGLEGTRGGESLIGRVGGSSLESAFAEDERDGVRYQTFVIDDKNSLHGPPCGDLS